MHWIGLSMTFAYALGWTGGTVSKEVTMRWAFDMHPAKQNQELLECRLLF